jgi:hypothetical protein
MKQKLAPKNRPVKTFEFDRKVYAFGGLKYRDSVEFLGHVLPAFKGVFDGSATIDYSMTDLFDALGDSLPKMALLILNAATVQNAEPHVWTLDEVLNVATPFSLLNIVSGYVVWSDIPGEFVQLLKSVSELMAERNA